MTIGELLKSLDYVNENTIIKNITLKDFGSDRGDYYDFYIGESKDGEYTVKELREFLINEVIGQTFGGYKGEDFIMDESSYIRLGMYGCSGYPIDGILINEVGVILKPQKILYY